MLINNKFILVVGGAGYIGSHILCFLERQGYTPIVLDNLRAGHPEVLSDTAKLIVGDISDYSLLDKVFSSYSFTAVMHFASLIQVGESVQNPGIYYSNNVLGSLHLLNAMLKWNVKKIIFSSSAAVYGEPHYSPIDEKHPIAPLNPYGHSKRMVEQMLEDFSRAYDFQFAALRYFNAAGADNQHALCERHEPETHLIPLILQAANHKKSFVTVHGADYSTPDGTCIRDYIHVMDLCEAHCLALDALLSGKKSLICNLGTGQGYSVKEVINVAQRVTKCDIAIQYDARRAGDPAVLVADAGYAGRELGWKPQHSDLETIIQDAWQAQRRL